jgi:hypothetical protein
MHFSFVSQRGQAVAVFCAVGLLLSACNGATKNKVEDKAAKTTTNITTTTEKKVKPVKAPAVAVKPTAKTTDKTAAKFVETPFKISFNNTESTAGKPAVTTINIVPLDGYKINKDFPNSLKIDTTANAEIKKTDFTAQDAKLSEQLLSFGVDFTAKATGNLALSGAVNFSVCNERVCKLFRGEKLAWAVSIK